MILQEADDRDPQQVVDSYVTVDETRRRGGALTELADVADTLTEPLR
jgi:hypothetical protein